MVPLRKGLGLRRREGRSPIQTNASILRKVEPRRAGEQAAPHYPSQTARFFTVAARIADTLDLYQTRRGLLRVRAGEVVIGPSPVPDSARGGHGWRIERRSLGRCAERRVTAGRPQYRLQERL